MIWINLRKIWNIRKMPIEMLLFSKYRANCHLVCLYHAVIRIMKRSKNRMFRSWCNSKRHWCIVETGMKAWTLIGWCDPHIKHPDVKETSFPFRLRSRFVTLSLLNTFQHIQLASHHLFGKSFLIMSQVITYYWRLASLMIEVLCLFHCYYKITELAF